MPTYRGNLKPTERALSPQPYPSSYRRVNVCTKSLKKPPILKQLQKPTKTTGQSSPKRKSKKSDVERVVSSKSDPGMQGEKKEVETENSTQKKLRKAVRKLSEDRLTPEAVYNDSPFSPQNPRTTRLNTQPNAAPFYFNSNLEPVEERSSFGSESSVTQSILASSMNSDQSSLFGKSFQSYQSTPGSDVQLLMQRSPP